MMKDQNTFLKNTLVFRMHKKESDIAVIVI